MGCINSGRGHLWSAGSDLGVLFLNDNGITVHHGSFSIPFDVAVVLILDL